MNLKSKLMLLFVRKVGTVAEMSLFPKSKSHPGATYAANAATSQIPTDALPWDDKMFLLTTTSLVS